MKFKKNWLILYTRTGAEKSVAELLSKKGFSVFLPLNHTGQSEKGRYSSHLLFPSYVFVSATQDQIPSLIDIRQVINILYWQNSPATVTNREIEAISSFLKNYPAVTISPLKKIGFNNPDARENLQESFVVNEKKLEEELSLELPSLGVILTAKKPAALAHAC